MEKEIALRVLLDICACVRQNDLQRLKCQVQIRYFRAKQDAEIAKIKTHGMMQLLLPQASTAHRMNEYEMNPVEIVSELRLNFVHYEIYYD